jgi:hypothetical protein
MACLTFTRKVTASGRRQAVIVAEGEIHHRADDDLAVDGDGALGDGVQAEDGALRRIDDGGRQHRAEDAAVGDGEDAALEVGEGDLALAGLLAASAMAFSMSAMPSVSQLRMTGTISPFSVETAMPTS